MSRIGKNPVAVPSGVEVSLKGRILSAKGKLGQLSFETHDDVSVKIEDGAITVAPNNNSKRARALWGTTRSCLANIVSGVSQGFTRRLEISGVGYRAAVQGKTLVLQLGFSHDVNFAIPEGLTVKCEKPTSIEITGFDKQVIGQFAAEIRALRPPEPYKGKGIRYEGESILRKEGKKK
jgi:large subunit ribosomal protein L6